MVQIIITIAIAIVVFIIFWIRNIRLWAENFEGPMGYLNESMLNMGSTLYIAPAFRGLFSAHENFANFTWDMIRAFILFVIIIVVGHFFDFILIPILFIIPLSIKWVMFSHRKHVYYQIPYKERYPFEPIYKASLCCPLFANILYVLMLAFYII